MYSLSVLSRHPVSQSPIGPFYRFYFEAILSLVLHVSSLFITVLKSPAQINVPCDSETKILVFDYFVEVDKQR